MAERIGAGVSVALGIGCAADTEGIENENECARHRNLCVSLLAKT
jgi:hypothetical protein